MAMPTVKVKIGADTDELNQSLAKATRNMRAFASGAAKRLAKGAAVVGAAAAVAGVALLALGRSQANIIDQNTKLARSLGLTHDEFVAMAQVAGEAGVATGQLSQLLGTMQRNIIELGKGTKAQEDAFARLGISMSDVRGASPADQFAMIADSLNAIKDPATRTATAMDIFGKSGRGAINMLDGYSEKVAEAAAFQERFALTVSQTDASAIEAANDAFGRVWDVLKGVGNMIAVFVAPLIKHMTDAFFDSGVSAETFGRIGSHALALIGGLIDGIRMGILGFEYAFEKAKQYANLFAAGTIRTLMPVVEVLDKVRGAAGQPEAWSGLMDAFAMGFDQNARIAEGAAGTALKSLENLESTVDRIRRIQDEVKAGLGGEGAPLVKPEGDDAPTNLPPGIGGAEKVTEDMQMRLEALREGLMTEQEEIDAWYARGREALAYHLALTGQMDAQSKQDRARLESEYRSRVDALQSSSADQEKRSAGQAATASLSALGTVFKKSKVIKVATAIMDTYAGATRALSDYAAPYSYVVAASVVAAGLANVQSIMSASSSGGGGGGGGGGAAAAGAAPAAEAPTTTFQFNLRGDSGGFGESMLRDLVEQINSTQRNGGRFIGVIA